MTFAGGFKTLYHLDNCNSKALNNYQKALESLLKHEKIKLHWCLKETLKNGHVGRHGTEFMPANILTLEGSFHH